MYPVAAVRPPLHEETTHIAESNHIAELRHGPDPQQELSNDEQAEEGVEECALANLAAHDWPQKDEEDARD